MRLTADYPKLWLLLAILLACAAGRLWPHGPVALAQAGWVLAGAGLVLLIAAAMQMRRADTPSDPHAPPRALVTDGLFALSRNPIYLADALILTGLCAAFHAPLAVLILTPPLSRSSPRALSGLRKPASTPPSAPPFGPMPPAPAAGSEVCRLAAPRDPR